MATAVTATVAVSIAATVTVTIAVEAIAMTIAITAEQAVGDITGRKLLAFTDPLEQFLNTTGKYGHDVVGALHTQGAATRTETNLETSGYLLDVAVVWAEEKLLLFDGKQWDAGLQDEWKGLWRMRRPS